MTAFRRIICPKAPLNWEAEWIPPVLRAVPNFCPWCGERIETHNSYTLTVTTGAAILEALDA